MSKKEELGKSFPEVFDALKDGNYIVRKTWKSGTYLHKINSTTLVQAYDLLADDWMILKL